MSLRQMEYLVTVAEEGSFTRAAERLFVSQPALSHQIKALEQSVGGELLERLPNAVGLTPMGRAYLPHAIAAVRAAEEARHAARAVGDLEAGQLRIATLHSIALGVIPAAIRAWRLGNPEVSFELHEYLDINELVQQMRLGVADVAVGPRPLGWDGPMRTLGDEELVVVVAVDDPLVQGRRKRIKLARLADRPWTLYSPDNGLSPVVLEACAAAGFTPRPAVHTHHSATAAQLAAAGLGPALVPENVLEPGFTGALLRPDPPVRRELVAFARADPSPLVTAFTDVLEEHAVIDPRRPSILPGRQAAGRAGSDGGA
jgi:DNA-binding transcriptional LysR family regulator